MKNKIICLIIARGGSKSLPNKNIIKINKIPLIAYSILQAKQIKSIQRVIVSTDSQKIMKISKKFGAEILFKRPKKISGDLSTDLEVFEHAINWLKKNENYIPDYIVDLRAPEPIRSIKKIKQALNIILKKRSADSLRSMNESKSSPNHMFQIKDGKYKNIINNKSPFFLNNLRNFKKKNKKYYWQNGYVDITRPSTVLKKSSMVGDSVLPFIINDKVHNLDYPEDIPIVASALNDILEGNDDDSIIETERHPV